MHFICFPKHLTLNVALTEELLLPQSNHEPEFALKPQSESFKLSDHDPPQPPPRGSDSTHKGKCYFKSYKCVEVHLRR